MLLNYIPILDPKVFMLGKKTPCNGLSLKLYVPFDFQQVTYSVPLFDFNSNIKIWLINKHVLRIIITKKDIYHDNNVNQTFKVIQLYLALLVFLFLLLML